MPNRPEQKEADALSTPRRAPVRIGLVQMCSGIDHGTNTKTALDYISEAASQGAELVVTPEMTTAVDQNARRLAQSTPEGENVQPFSDLSRELGIWLVIGSMVVKEKDGALANRTVILAPNGETAARYDKMHMFDVSLPNGEEWRESAVYSPGSRAVLVDAGFAKFAPTICYDIRFPMLYRQLAQAGAEIFLVPAAFTRPTGQAHWETLLRARAIENGAFVVAPAQGGRHEDGRETYGHSIVIDPWGDIIGHRANDTPGIVIADLDLNKVEEVRRRIPNLALERNFEVIKLPA